MDNVRTNPSCCDYLFQLWSVEKVLHWNAGFSCDLRNVSRSEVREAVNESIFRHLNHSFTTHTETLTNWISKLVQIKSSYSRSLTHQKECPGQKRVVSGTWRLPSKNWKKQVFYIYACIYIYTIRCQQIHIQYNLTIQSRASYCTRRRCWSDSRWWVDRQTFHVLRGPRWFAVWSCYVIYIYIYKCVCVFVCFWSRYTFRFATWNLRTLIEIVQMKFLKRTWIGFN